MMRVVAPDVDRSTLKDTRFLCREARIVEGLSVGVIFLGGTMVGRCSSTRVDSLHSRRYRGAS